MSMKPRAFRVMNFLAAFSLAMFFSSAVGSQEKKEKEEEKKKSSVHAVVGATVLPVSGPMVRRGTVTWKDGKILEVGAELDPPEGAEVHKGKGLYVCPGFVSVVSMGVGIETSSGNIRNGLNPWDRELAIALASGITTVQALPAPFFGGFGQDRPLSGGSNSAIIKLTRGDLGGMLVREPAMNYFSLPTRQLELNYFLMRERFNQAKKYLASRAEARAKKAKEPKLSSSLKLYVAVLENTRPTIFSPANNHEVKIVLSLSKEYGFDVVLNEPKDAWMMAAELAAGNVPVLVKSRGRDFDFNTTGPVFEKGQMAPVRRPAAFARAGCLVSILPYRRGITLSGLAGRDLATLHVDAAFAVRGGMSNEDALEAITLNPARILRVDDRLGSIEKGKDADLLILSGHPLDYRSFVLKAFINGKLYYERDKSRIFREVPLTRDK